MEISINLPQGCNAVAELTDQYLDSGPAKSRMGRVIIDVACGARSATRSADYLSLNAGSKEEAVEGAVASANRAAAAICIDCPNRTISGR